MTKQYTTDWNERFLSSDTPWEEPTPSYHLIELLNKYTQKGQTILEVGCGFGTNARWLAELGYRVYAIDISENAIIKAKALHQNISGLSFDCVDFLTSQINQKFDIIFDKGCLHSFSDLKSYSIFSQQVYAHLNTNGIWIDISGNANQNEDIEIRKSNQYPRMTLREIASSIEPYFEILEIKRGIFGTKNNFLSWVGVYLKRSDYDTPR